MYSQNSAIECVGYVLDEYRWTIYSNLFNLKSIRISFYSNKLKFNKSDVYISNTYNDRYYSVRRRRTHVFPIHRCEKKVCFVILFLEFPHL